MKIYIPEEVNEILSILHLNDFEAYIVGGCVRDSIIGRIPTDWDICTNAKPEKILNILKDFKVIPTGLKHGTISIVINEKQFEVTTYRIEKEYVDGRHPLKVEFTDSLVEDLKRRDFTINTMVYNHKKGLIDYYNGIEDIYRKRIRCVGDSRKRFNEDYLRMLRAVRFSTQLGFDIDIKTFKAIRELSYKVINVSKERIRDEVNKIVLSKYPSKGIELLEASGLLKYIIPELQRCVKFEQKNPHHDKDVFNHIMSVLNNTEEDLVLRLAALFHDIGKPQCFTIDKDNIGHFYNHQNKSMEITEDILKRLKYDNRTIEVVKKLVKNHMLKYEDITPKAMKRLINRVGCENVDMLFRLQIADIKGSKIPHDFSKINKAKNLYRKILEEKQPITVKDLNINGYDLIEIGIQKGKEIGIILNRLLDWVLENPDFNKKEILLNKVKSFIDKDLNA